jgi:hypothetical protein
VACCTRSDLHHASVAAFCAVSTKVCVAAFCAICIDVLTAALCGSSIMLLLLHSVQIPPRFLMLPAVQLPLMCTLLHSAGVPSCFSCCNLSSFHQGSCCCIPAQIPPRSPIAACCAISIDVHAAALCGSSITAFCCCRASYCEIYNEALYDLLKFTKQQLQVRWDSGKGFYVPELAVKECTSVEDMLEVWDALLYQSDIVPLVIRSGCQRMQLIEKHAGGMGCTTVRI